MCPRHSSSTTSTPPRRGRPWTIDPLSLESQTEACAFTMTVSRLARRDASGGEQHLDGAVLLALEHGVGVGGLGERQAVGGEVVDTERVVVAREQRQDLVDPSPDVRLA